MTKSKILTLAICMYVCIYGNLFSQNLTNVPINSNDELNICNESGETGVCQNLIARPVFRNSIGLNYNFSDESNVSILEGISPNWRQFTLWHNAGFNPISNTTLVCVPQNSSLDLIVFPWDCNINPFSGTPEDVCDNQDSPELGYEFDPSFTYNFNNFIEPPFDNNSRMNYVLNNEVEGIENVFSTFNSSIDNLSTDYFYTGSWSRKDNTREAIWRKPVPFWKNDNSTSDADFLLHETFEDENSYRYFAEYMSYYTGIMGSGSSMPDHYNYSDDLPLSGLGFNTHVELWNEPDAWWTWPNDYAYVTPAELAALCHAAIGIEQNDNYDITNTNINDICTPGGIKFNRPNLQLISPSPHEMDLAYMTEFMGKLRSKTAMVNGQSENVREDFGFDVYAFHHYSAYSTNDLNNLFMGPIDDSIDAPIGWTNPGPDDIVAQSLAIGGTTYQYNFGNNEIKTVTLEASPSNAEPSFWICPELDGYYQRGVALRAGIDAIDPGKPIWITEWGYPSITSQSAKYPKGLNQSETQARWLMRGFLEYDRAIDIESSHWHWYQDVKFGTGWDTFCGIINDAGVQKTSWFYLKTMMNEIGDKRFQESRVIKRNGCEDLDTPSMHIDNNGIVVGNEPDINCPRIYKYSGECCVDIDAIGDSSENFSDNVWTAWFPTMVNHEETMRLYLVEDLNVVGEPTDYYTVEPVNGNFDGLKSDIFPVSTDPTNNEKFIEVKITEKPLFIHFVGECVCNNDNPGNDPGNGCTENASPNNITQTCTSISFDLDFTIPNFLSCELSTGTPTLTSINIGGFSSSSNAGFNTPQLSMNTATLEFVGLTPGTSYDFQIVLGYEVDGEFGVYVYDTSTDPNANFATLASDCFSGMQVDINTSTLFNCDGANISFDIQYANADDASILSLSSSLVQLKNPNDDCGGAASSYPIPLGTIPAVNWTFNQGQGVQSFITSTTALNLNPEACYCLTYNIADEDNNIYGQGEHNFCLEGQNCIEQVAPVNILSATCGEVCFTPSTNISGECANAYRLEIVDQAGNVASRFIPVGPTGFSNTCSPDDEFCFNASVMEELLATLTTPPFVGHIRSFTNIAGSQFTTNSDFFDISDCCEPKGVFLDDIEFNVSCYEDYQYAHFCINVDDFATCIRNEQGEIEISNITVSSPLFDSDITTDPSGSNCYTVSIHTASQQICSQIFFKITATAVNFLGEDIDFTFTGLIPICCTVTLPPGPSESIMTIESNETRTNEIEILGHIPDLMDEAQLSRSKRLPTKYALINKNTHKIINLNKFTDQLDLTIPEMVYDAAYLNENYALYLLADEFIYPIDFPIEEITPRAYVGDSLSDLNKDMVTVYPNPSSNLVNIDSKLVIKNIMLQNTQGINLLNKATGSKHVRFSVQGTTPGIYLLSIVLENGENITQKLIID